MEQRSCGAGDVGLAFLFILFPKPLCASRNRQQGVLEALLRRSQRQSQEKKARPLSLTGWLLLWV